MDIACIALLYIVACIIEISNIVQCTTHMLHLACWANHDAHTAVIHTQLITQQKLIKLRNLEIKSYSIVNGLALTV